MKAVLVAVPLVGFLIYDYSAAFRINIFPAVISDSGAIENFFNFHLGVRDFLYRELNAEKSCAFFE